MSNNDFSSLLDMDSDRPLHPVPYVASALMRIRLCQTVAALDQCIEALGPVFDILTNEDCNTVTVACDAKRAMLAPSTGSDATPLVTMHTPLGALLNQSAEETRTTLRSRRVNAPTQETMRQAIVASRATVSDLLKDGMALAIDPAKGSYGVVIAFGKRKAEVDPVTKRDRQALIVWADLIAVLKANDLDEKLLGKAPSDHRHFSDAVGIVNNSGYVARAVKTPVDCEAQWIVGSVNADADDRSLGVKELVVTLHSDGRIETSNEGYVAITIKHDFYRRTGEERITATMLRDRIERALTKACQARDCDLGIYVAPAFADKARKLITALRPLAGRNLYMITPASAEEISEGLALGFESEIEKLESDVEARKGNTSKTAGSTLIERIETAKQSATGLRYVLGEDTTNSFLARLRACDEVVVAEMDATVQRATMLELS